MPAATLFHLMMQTCANRSPIFAQSRQRGSRVADLWLGYYSLPGQLAGFYMLNVLRAFHLRSHHVTCVFLCSDCLVVASTQGVDADLGHLFEHLHAVFEIAHPAALIVPPGNGHFHDA